MSGLEMTVEAPLTRWEDGSIRITGSRVPIDTIVYHFKLGATAEEIFYKFPSLQLAQIYGASHYYLTYPGQVENTCVSRKPMLMPFQQTIESDPQYQKSKAELRERLLARWAETAEAPQDAGR
jgi:uncharacterized protein (DUF433 family)